MVVFVCAVGGGHAALHGGGRAHQRGVAHEEDHVGAVLVCASEVLQVPLHRRQGMEYHKTDS